jgi:hypothetical protein
MLSCCCSCLIIMSEIEGKTKVLTGLGIDIEDTPGWQLTS